MNILFDQIFENREAAALPSLAESGGLPALISGLGAVHRANLAAALRARTGRPLVVICPDDTAAENMARDLAAMLGEEAVTLGLRDFTFCESEAVSRQAEQKRLGALWALLGGAPVAAVSVSGLIQRTIPPQTLREAAFTVRDGEDCAQEDLVDALVRCGYSRCEQVEGPGQFAVRGGILDFFSPFEREPVRIEFWGDTVDSMGHFDVSDQRRTDRVERCTVLPAAETVPALCPGGRQALCREMENWAARYERRRTSETARKAAETIRADAERLAGGALLSCADKYMELIYAPACAADYLNADAIVLLEKKSGVKTDEIIDKIKALVKEGNVNKIRVKRGDQVLLTIPVNVGIIGGLVGLAAAPLWSILAAAAAAYGFDCKFEIVKNDGSSTDVM